MLAVSRDALPSILYVIGIIKSPTRTHHISQVWACYPSEYACVSVFNLPERSTTFTCRHTERFRSSIVYAKSRKIATNFFGIRVAKFDIFLALMHDTICKNLEK